LVSTIPRRHRYTSGRPSLSVVLGRFGDGTRGRVILLAILWSLGGVVIWGPFSKWVLRMLTLFRKAPTWCSILLQLMLSIHHTQETSVHSWSTQPSTIQHPTPARRYG
jgi:hypothetical protein